MTVKQLIDELSQMPDDAVVKFTYNSGDYWHTVLAGDIKNVEEGTVSYSEYHGKDAVAGDDETDKPNLKRAVLLT